jgi:hypothetical protein
MDFLENFQDVNDFDNINLDYKTDNNFIDTSSEEENKVIVEEELKVQEEFKSNKKNKKQKSQKSNKIEESFKNLEGFRGGETKEYNNFKLLLKSILFGLLFYLLSNEKIYKLTKPYLNGLDKNIVHSIVFIVLFYLINLIA